MLCWNVFQATEQHLAAARKQTPAQVLARQLADEAAAAAAAAQQAELQATFGSFGGTSGDSSNFDADRGSLGSNGLPTMTAQPFRY